MNKYNTSSASRADLRSFLNHLEMKDISYSMDGDIIEFDETELDKAGQNIVAKLFDVVNEAIDPLPSYEVIAGLATVLGALDVAYGIKGGDSIVIDATKALKSYIGDKINAVGPAAKRVIAKFKKDPKVKKIIMDASDPKLNKRAVDKWVDILDHINGMDISQDSKDLITNYLSKAPIDPKAKIKDLISHSKEMLEIKESNAIMEDKAVLKYYDNSHRESDIKLFEEFFVNEAKEATRGAIYKAVKKADYPVAVVVIEKGAWLNNGYKPKVVHQQLVNMPEAVPAAVKTLQKKYPLARISVESNSGLIVFTESVMNEFGPGYSPQGMTRGISALVNRIGDLDVILMKDRKAEREWEEMSQRYLDGEEGSAYWGDLDDQELEDAIDDAESLMRKYRIKESVNVKESREGRRAGLSKEETLEVAKRFAKALSITDGVPVTVNMTTLDNDSFDLDYDGDEFDGGSYNIYDDGAVKNMATRKTPTLGYKDDSVQSIVKYLKKHYGKLAKNESVNESIDIKLFEEYFDSLNEAPNTAYRVVGDSPTSKESNHPEITKTPYEMNEAQKYDIEAAVRAIRDYNRSGKSSEDFEDMAISIADEEDFQKALKS